MLNRCSVFVFLFFLVLPALLPGQTVSGKASYYADRFHLRPTSTGETYDKNKLTAASKDYPVGTILRVSRAKSGKTVDVRVNDCGPHRANRILDLSGAAARRLDLIRDGVATVNVEVVSLGTEGPTCDRSLANRRTKDTSPGVADKRTVIRDVQPVSDRAAVPTRPAAVPVVAIATDYVVQLGVYSNGKNALNALREFQAAGLTNLILFKEGRTVSIFNGPYDAKLTAQNQAADMEQRYKVKGYVKPFSL